MPRKGAGPARPGPAPSSDWPFSKTNRSESTKSKRSEEGIGGYGEGIGGNGEGIDNSSCKGKKMERRKRRKKVRKENPIFQENSNFSGKIKHLIKCIFQWELEIRG